MFRGVSWTIFKLARKSNTNFIPRRGMTETSAHDENTFLKDRVMGVEQIDNNKFRSSSDIELSVSTRRYGGQVMAEAMIAASKAVNDPKLMIKSFYCYFIRPSPIDTPQVYDVCVDRTAGIHHSAHCTVKSYAAPDKVSLILMSSFGLCNESSVGLNHVDMPNVPPPEQLDTFTESDLVKFMLMLPKNTNKLPGFFKTNTMEWKPVDKERFRNVQHTENCRQAWFRVVPGFFPSGSIDDTHSAAVIYMLDLVIVVTARMTALPPPELDLRVASLDHSMWFHRPFRADQWHLVELTNDKAEAGRGLVEGHIWTADGQLVSSFGQEGIFRAKDG